MRGVLVSSRDSTARVDVFPSWSLLVPFSSLISFLFFVCFCHFFPFSYALYTSVGTNRPLAKTCVPSLSNSRSDVEDAAEVL